MPASAAVPPASGEALCPAQPASCTAPRAARREEAEAAAKARAQAELDAKRALGSVAGYHKSAQVRAGAAYRWRPSLVADTSMHGSMENLGVCYHRARPGQSYSAVLLWQVQGGAVVARLRACVMAQGVAEPGPPTSSPPLAPAALQEEEKLRRQAEQDRAAALEERDAALAAQAAAEQKRAEVRKSAQERWLPSTLLAYRALRGWFAITCRHSLLPFRRLARRLAAGRGGAGSVPGHQGCCGRCCCGQ